MSKGKTKIPVFKRIKSKFERSEGQGENYNVWKNKTRIPMFGRIRSQIQSLEG